MSAPPRIPPRWISLWKRRDGAWARLHCDAGQVHVEVPGAADAPFHSIWAAMQHLQAAEFWPAGPAPVGEVKQP